MFPKENLKMKLIEPNDFHIVDKALDVISVIRQRSTRGQVEDGSVYICNISDIVEKHQIWQQHLPRVIPFYGKYSSL